MKNTTVKNWIADDINKTANDILKYYDGVEKGRWARQLKQLASEMKGEKTVDVI
jgi:hypothetical protein